MRRYDVRGVPRRVRRARIREPRILIAARQRELLIVVFGQHLERVEVGVGRRQVIWRPVGRQRRRVGPERDRIVRVRIDAIDHEARVGPADVELKGVLGAVALVVPGDLRHAADVEQPLVIVNVLDAGVVARQLSEAETAAERAAVAEQAERIGAAGRVVGVDQVVGERVLAANLQGAVRRAREADITAGIVPLAGAARVAVRLLIGARNAVLTYQRARAVGELERIRIEAGVHVGDELDVGDQR